MGQEFAAKIKPYLGEVKQLTDRTFPDLFSGSGLGNLGGLFGGGMGVGMGVGMGGSFRGPASDVLSGLIGSSVADARPSADIGSNPFIQSQANSSPYTLGIK